MLFALLSLVTAAAAAATVIQSPINPNVTLNYRSPPAGICNTVFATQKQYTGYISLPPYTLAPIQQNYSINTFFWFIEARDSPSTAPLTVWLNGGPGSSSMIGLFTESGPCEVIMGTDGSYTTQSRLWGWDRSSNVLYVDQPAQVGFSYDSLVNGSLDLRQANLIPTTPPQSLPAGAPAWSYLNGTFASGQGWGTTNTSEIAAYAVWHFLQGFLSSFPQYNPGTRSNSTTVNPVGVNLFAESYGGRYAPTFADVFEEQNAKRAAGTLPSNSTLEVKLSSVGIINGIIDSQIQTPYYPRMLYNNTYGLQLIDQTTQLNALNQYSRSGGVREQIQACRNAVAQLDANDNGDAVFANSVCQNASAASNQVLNIISATGRNVYDIRVKDPSSSPPSAYMEFLNQPNVLSAIGAQINYTDTSIAVYNEFDATGDQVRAGGVSDLAYLLSIGVRVALIYGDADYICNWMGGEAVSLAIAANQTGASSSNRQGHNWPMNFGPYTTSNVNYASLFPAAGYADIIVNSSYVGGSVRQYGNLSFSRIYDSGHLVPFYQPETAFTVFARIVQGVDIGTGNTVNLTTFGTKGPANTTYSNKLPTAPQPSATCWIRAFGSACTDDQQSAILRGEGTVVAGVWSSTMPSSTSTPTSSPTTGTSTSVAPTGVYVATGSVTPTPSKGGAMRQQKSSFMASVPVILMLLYTIGVFGSLTDSINTNLFT